MVQNIVFLIRDLGYGGAQRQLVELTKHLCKESLNVTVLFFYSGGIFEKELKDSGVQVVCLEKRGRWHLFGFFWNLVKHLKQLHPNVLHGYLGESNVVTVLSKPFFPSTRVVWGIRGSKEEPVDNDRLVYLIEQLEQFLSQFSDLIIVNSHAGQADCLARGFPAGKMMIIPNGIDVEHFKPDQEAGAKVRTEWGISENKVLIGLVGRLNPMKDHHTFLRAVALLCQERQDVHFVCVGEGPENYALELYQQAAQLDISEKVIWAGTRTDMPAVHNALNIAVSASAYGEGFSNAIAEAMACGVPCIVTDVGDSARLVGNTGIVIPPKNPNALKAAILSLIEDLEANGCNREYIRQRIVNQFSLKGLVLKTKAALLS